MQGKLNYDVVIDSPRTRRTMYKWLTCTRKYAEELVILSYIYTTS